MATPALVASATPSGDVRCVSLQLGIKCDHCGSMVPINGPARSVHCDDCLRDTPLLGLGEQLSMASIDISELDSNYTSKVFEDPGAQCSKCEAMIPIGDYIKAPQSPPTIPCSNCGAGAMSYPAPDWLKELLPNALQVFGGEPVAADGRGGASLVVENEPEPVVMACPNCGGGLTITQEAERTTACHYCNASVFLPDQLWRRLHPVRVMRRWALRYAFPLRTATELQKEAAQRDDHQRKQAEQQALAAQHALAAHHAEIERQRSADAAKSEASNSNKKLLIGLAVGVVLIAGVAVLAATI
jgi:hypothetical protein